MRYFFILIIFTACKTTPPDHIEESLHNRASNMVSNYVASPAQEAMLISDASSLKAQIQEELSYSKSIGPNLFADCETNNSYAALLINQEGEVLQIFPANNRQIACDRFVISLLETLLKNAEWKPAEHNNQAVSSLKLYPIAIQ